MNRLLKKGFYSNLPLFLLLILPWITYFNSLNNEFVFDDLPLIQANKKLPSLNNVNNILNTLVQKHGYRPIRALSYAIDYHFSGLNPVSYHISNILFHTLNGFLVYVLTFFLLKKKGIAFINALLFSTHPVHTDSVTYIAGRRDVLFTFFYFLGLCSFVKYRETQRYIFISVALLAYLLSIGSKEMGVTLPAIFFLYDLLSTLSKPRTAPSSSRLKKLSNSLREVWRQYNYFYTMLLCGVLAFVWYKIVINPASYQTEYYGHSLFITLLTTCKIITHYLRLLLFPVNLVADYSYDAFPLASSLLEWSTLLPFLLLLTIVLLLFKLLLVHQWIAFGGFWFFITLLPVCHLIPHHELLAEHYLYLPSYGFCLIAAIMFDSLLQDKRFPFLFLASLVMVVSFFCIRIVDRNRDWRDGMTLWSKTVQTVPRCARALNNLATEHIKRGNYQEASNYINSALGIKPNFAEALNNLGIIYNEQGQYEEAYRLFLKASSLKKRYLGALVNIANYWVRKGEYEVAIKTFNLLIRRNPDSPDLYNQLGVVYQLKGELREAQEQFTKALDLNNRHLEARNNLGTIYQKQGLHEKAINEFKYILDIKPDYAEVHANLANAYKNKGWYDEAIKEFTEALRLKPGFLDAMNNLGNVYRAKGLPEKAIETFNHMLDINPELALPHVNLAICYLYDKKDNKKALYHLERALELDPSFPQASTIKRQIEELKKMN